MKYKVTISFEIDTDTYFDCGPEKQDAVNLVSDMLIGDADMPDERHIEVEAL